jgi:acyl-homoserine-lactone acylase
VNEYAQRHGDTIDPSFRRVLPFVPTDVTAGIQNTVHFHFMPAQDNLPALISAWQSGGISAANAVACSFTPGCSTGSTVAANMTHGGSNGWAIAPGKSASGNAILLGNPHLPWGNNIPIPPIDGLGIYQWMEVNLVLGDPTNPDLNASGAVLLGAPFIGIGYSDEIGWTHTDNTIQNTNLYELTLDALGFYNFGGIPLPLVHTTDTIKVRQADGSLVSQGIDIYNSVHGPLVARNGNKVLALRVAGLDQPSVVSQYWNMISAHNLQEFIAANSALQVPFFNVIYADRDGHILYVFGGRQPVRQGGDWGKYSGVLDGSDPSLLWTRTFAWSELPRAIDPPGGFVANSNDPPWTSTFPQTATNSPDNFPAYVSPQFMDLRPQNGALLLQSILQLKTTLSVMDVLSAKESTHMLLADRVLDDLIAAAQQYPSPIAPNPIATKAAAVLKAWDRNADATSQGAVLFEAWWTNVLNDLLNPNLALRRDNTINFYSPHPPFGKNPDGTTGWEASNPLNTPTGLFNASAWVPDLIKAAQLVAGSYCATPPFCPLDVPWGTVHKIVLATHTSDFQTVISLTDDPQSGADDPFGPLRVLFRFPRGDGTFFPISGDGYVQLVEFTPQGANAQALLGYGNASRPGSSHITDQLQCIIKGHQQCFEAKALRPVYRTRQDVKAHMVSQEVVY